LLETRQRLPRLAATVSLLHERRLSLSKRKTRIGTIDAGFHFLGINYPPTQPVDNINTTPINDTVIADHKPKHFSGNNL
jgi:hypothetical protein